MWVSNDNKKGNWFCHNIIHNFIERFYHCTWTVVFCTLIMLKNVFKRLMKVRLCSLMWSVLVLTFFYIMLLVYNTDITKLAAQYPVIILWTADFTDASIKHCSSDVKCYVTTDRKQEQYNNIGAYLFYASNIDFKSLPVPRKPTDIIWGLIHEESPRNVQELLHEDALSLFNFSSTFSRFSNVPFPLQYLKSYTDLTSQTYFVETVKKNKFLNDIAPIMYLQSDCDTSTERDAYVKELMKYTKVDSYGKCLKNKDMPSKFKDDYLNNLNEDEFLRFIARYKFVVAIENGACNDYITEKFWRAIKVGTVPIYFGSPTIRDWLPNKKSAILLEDYTTPKILNEHIKMLLNNDSLYEEYLEHKTKQLVTNQRLLNEYNDRPYQVDFLKIVDKFECFLCEKLHDKMKGGIGVNIVDKSHYDCPMPLSALTLNVNPENNWIYFWETAGNKAKENLQHFY